MERHIKSLEILHEGTVIPAIPLVLNSERKFNEQGQRTLIRYYLHAGVGGLAIGVHTTQFEIRDPKIGLFEPLLKIAAEEIDSFEKKTGKVIVRIAGACGPTEQAFLEAKIAKNLGYDAVLLSPGGLKNLSEEEMIERTKCVAALMPVIGFYLQPTVGGRHFSFDYWKAIADLDNVVAFKAAPFDRYMTLDLVRGCAFSERSDKVALYTGNDDNIVIDLLTKYEFKVNDRLVCKRFVGGLLGHWSVWTHNVVGMFELLKKHREDISIPSYLLTLATQVTDCNGAFFDVKNNFKGCIAGIHEVLRRQGLMEGIWCLNPRETLSPGQKEEIDRVYKAYTHLNDDEFVRKNIDSWK